MLIRVEKGSAVPISRQIADQLRAQCLSGRLTAGTQIPSVRQLARELTVNQNTVLRVYERLTAEGLLEMRHGEGLLEMRHGEGTYVGNGVSKALLNGQCDLFFDELTQLIRQGRMLGIDGPGLHVLLDSALTATQNEDFTSHTSDGEMA
jgi:GntR family transcriptional regulator